MATRNTNSRNLTFTAAQIILCLFFLLCTVYGTWKMFTLPNEANWVDKALNYSLGTVGLGFLINFLTTMFFGDKKRRELAETTYDRLDGIVTQLLIKSETERLTPDEFRILSQLAALMGSLGKECDVNIDVINNKYERLKNNPPQYLIPNQTTGIYGAVQAYDAVLLQHQYAPSVANSGSQAPPPITP